MILDPLLNHQPASRLSIYDALVSLRLVGTWWSQTRFLAKANGTVHCSFTRVISGHLLVPSVCLSQPPSFSSSLVAPSKDTHKGKRHSGLWTYFSSVCPQGFFFDKLMSSLPYFSSIIALLRKERNEIKFLFQIPVCSRGQDPLLTPSLSSDLLQTNCGRLTEGRVLFPVAQQPS